MEQNKIEIHGFGNEEFTTDSERMDDIMRNESRQSLDTIHTIKNKGNSKLSQHKLIKAIRNLEMIDDTDSEISIAQSDASIYEPLEKRLQKVYSEKRLNPLDQEVLLNKCPAIEIEKQLQKMINMEQSIKHK